MSDTPRTDAFEQKVPYSRADLLAFARQLERELVESDLRHAASNAENKLRHLGNTFNSTNFTDRYGDGPICIGIADSLRKALKSSPSR
jgi:hypothetical protein